MGPEYIVCIFKNQEEITVRILYFETQPDTSTLAHPEPSAE